MEVHELGYGARKVVPRGWLDVHSCDLWATLCGREQVMLGLSH